MLYFEEQIVAGKSTFKIKLNWDLTRSERLGSIYFILYYSESKTKECANFKFQIKSSVK